jgi:hypothetical protein
MQHFLNLEKCTCGAYRYLAVREHKKSYEIYLIHHMHFATGQDTRKYSKLASIAKYRVNIHDERINLRQKEKTIKLSIDQSLVLRSVLKQLEVSPESPENPTMVEEYSPDSDDNLEEFVSLET